MEIKDDRRTRKRLATRQSISDTATRLFLERGFDAVTIDDIAAAADVGRMTVFNHFPRKEDMFFDREEEIQTMAFEGIRKRGSGLSPIEAVQLYKELSEVERAFSNLKDVIDMRPIYHRTRERVEAHIFVAALAFLIHRAIEKKLKNAGLDLSATQALEALKSVSSRSTSVMER